MKCLECEEQIYGRSDKKFCNDICRTNHHNHLRAGNAAVNLINGILRRNQCILRGLNGGKRATMKREKVLASGLNFDYYTHEYRSPKGRVYRFCYTYGYAELSLGMFIIIKRDIFF